MDLILRTTQDTFLTISCEVMLNAWPSTAHYHTLHMFEKHIAKYSKLQSAKVVSAFRKMWTSRGDIKQRVDQYGQTLHHLEHADNDIQNIHTRCNQTA